MKIILIGPPGTGKGTQGKFILKKYKIPQISIGDILREYIDLKNDIGKKIINIVNQGKLVSNKIICSLLKKRINHKDCKNGFLLDGFPRTIEQAHYISQEKIKIDYILEITIPYELILERITGRRIHKNSGRIYHVKFNPPKIKNKDDITGEKLTIREDDKIEIIKKRFEEYKKISILLNKYYLEEEKKGNLKYFKIDGTKNLVEIKKIIENILK